MASYRSAVAGFLTTPERYRGTTLRICFAIVVRKKASEGVPMGLPAEPFFRQLRHVPYLPACKLGLSREEEMILAILP